MLRSPIWRRSNSYDSSNSGPPQPASVPASFQERSNASPTPVFMPRPPVGIIKCTASPARNTTIERLAQFREIAFTAELDTKLLSDLARTSVTPHEVRRPNVFRRAVSSPYEGGHSET